ncbi:MAG: sugar-binding transcriptional regulator [Leucobacter sp.]
MAGADSTNWETREQLLRAAWYYYVDQLTQDEVAKRLSISRATAGRLLERSRQTGIVTFTLGSSNFDAFQVGRKLRETFNLKEALVPPALEVEPTDPQAISHRLARGGAQYLQNMLETGQTLALGWGETVQATMERLPVEQTEKINTVALTGGVNTYVPTLRRERTIPGPHFDAAIPAPIVVSSLELASALRSEAVIQNALEHSRSAHHALIGIGALAEQATLAQEGYVTDAELVEFQKLGAVGDILGIFYDANGEVLDLSLHERRIGIGVDELRNIPNVVGIAGGMSKVDAILGALRGEYLDVLVTTEDVARALLAAEGVEV